MSIAHDKIEPQYIHIFYSTMEFPDDVLKIIREYSRPLTRPDWRTLHRMPYTQFLREFHETYRKRRRTLGIRVGRYKELFSEYNYCRIMYYS